MRVQASFSCPLWLYASQHRDLYKQRTMKGENENEIKYIPGEGEKQQQTKTHTKKRAAGRGGDTYTISVSASIRRSCTIPADTS